MNYEQLLHQAQSINQAHREIGDQDFQPTCQERVQLLKSQEHLPAELFKNSKISTNRRA